MWRILLVDEDRRSHESLVLACAPIGHLLCAPTAADARRVLAMSAVHLVVLEHRLPDANGLDVLAALRTQWPWLPVIMATAWGSESVCAAALKLGVRDYFIKPWTLSEMAASIRAILGATGRPAEERRNAVVVRAGPGSRMAAAPPPDAGAIRQAAERIKDALSEPVSFAELARELRLSKSALSRRFRQTIGTSYRHLVNDARIARARELLRSSDHTVTEIAQIVGFGDLPRFDKVFKAVTGAPPSLYRRQQAGGPRARNNGQAGQQATSRRSRVPDTRTAVAGERMTRSESRPLRAARRVASPMVTTRDGSTI